MSIPAAIRWTHFNPSTGQALTLAETDFPTDAEALAVWQTLPASDDDIGFLAELVDADGELIADRIVSMEVCERYTGRPAAQLAAQALAAFEAASAKVQALNPSHPCHVCSHGS